MATIGFIQSRRAAPGGPGRWRELAPLWVGWIGPAGARRPTRLSPDEQSTQVSLWCLLAAPLRLGCDLTRLDAFTLSLLANDEVLALDQDALGRPAALIARDDSVQTWARPLADGSIAVGFFNLGPDPAAGSLQWAELELTGPQIVRDLWRQRDLGAYTDRFDAPVTPHGVFLFRLRPAP
jgi:alpha-galactosidase